MLLEEIALSAQHHSIGLALGRFDKSRLRCGNGTAAGMDAARVGGSWSAEDEIVAYGGTRAVAMRGLRAGCVRRKWVRRREMTIWILEGWAVVVKMEKRRQTISLRREWQWHWRLLRGCVEVWQDFVRVAAVRRRCIEGAIARKRARMGGQVMDSWREMGVTEVRWRRNWIVSPATC